MDTTKQREEFEAALKLEMPMMYRLAFQSDQDDDEQMIHHAKSHVLDMGVMWQAAQKAALASIEIELPPSFPYEHDDLSSDIPVMDSRKVKKALKAKGLRVKS